MHLKYTLGAQYRHSSYTHMHVFRSNIDKKLKIIKLYVI